jgi:hypothetical protein
VAGVSGDRLAGLVAVPEFFWKLYEMAFSPNFSVAQIILSRQYQLYARGKFFLAPRS